MFNDKPYEAVNREERFYCALFAHALLSSAAVRRAFSDLVTRRCGLALGTSDLRVFLEAAALRDYWNDLGDPREYSDATHTRRREVLRALLRVVGLDEDLPDEHDFFWTAGARKPGSKVWSPGRWNLPTNGGSDLPGSTRDTLRQLKWAFNAKPDILLASSDAVLLVEAKVESGEGVYDDSDEGRQFATQRLIASVLVRMVPAFYAMQIRTATLGLADARETVVSGDASPHFSWDEVAACCDTPEVDGFTQRCFASLRRYRA
ncbi:MAG TPA: hypothetical protein VG389_28240 [Myxococcota bacterium]|nr:hypothetical protein [Myxococcota bacterium]